ncbi:ATP-binding protein [Streptomyces sp. HNM0574]|uniref:ATP-binding protein n=1 Tax=Streptomyces sp. HNM0574 TaxID=2714954 RepID=UPI001469C4BD|nr:ATP-binding protein [Streptomyces sp. HNM0574]NLU70621.1 ATP-binding protein [Streptomyces sp. HNM0574]
MDGDPFATLPAPNPTLPSARPGPEGEAADVRHDGFDLPAQASAVAQARERVCGRLEHWGLPEDLGHTAQLVVSEFFTNALLHTDSERIRCRLRVCSERLRIEVVDEGGDAEVTPREAEPGDVNGRGLQLVGAVAEEWGVHASEHPARTVWAELSLAVP